MCYNKRMQDYGLEEGINEQKQALGPAEKVLRVALAALIVAQIVLLASMRAGDTNRNDVELVAILLTAPTIIMWCGVFFLSYPKASVKVIRSYLVYRRRHARWPITTAEKWREYLGVWMPVAAAFLTVLIIVLYIFDIQGKTVESMTSFQKTYIVIGITVIASMGALALYSRFAQKHKLLSQPHALTTGLACQNILIGILLIISVT